MSLQNNTAPRDGTIPCPADVPGRRGGGIGGQAFTSCLFCGEMSPSTAGGHHRPVVLSDLAERLRKADDYDIVVAQRDIWKERAQA